MKLVPTCQRAYPFLAKAPRPSTRACTVCQRQLFHTSQRLDGNKSPSSRPRKHKTDAKSKSDAWSPRREWLAPAAQSSATKQSQPWSVDRDLSQILSSPNSSVTTSERKVFEVIRQKFGSNVGSIFSTPDSQGKNPPSLATKDLPLYDLDVDNILSLFAPEIVDEQLRNENFEPMSAGSSHSEAEVQTESVPDPSMPRVASPAEVRDTARHVLQQVSKDIRTHLQSSDPSPEHALWQYITNEIFPTVSLLQHPLLRPTANSFHRPYQLTIGDLTPTPDPTSNPTESEAGPVAEAEAKTEADTTKDTRSPSQPKLSTPSLLATVPPQTPVLPLITILYPSATLLAMRHYAAYLPSSDYSLALYPSIKNLGTISFLLGANVHFFNCLLQMHWTVYSDLGEISALLQDMRYAAVEYDSGTLSVLKAIVEDSRAEGKDGRAKEWWDLSMQKADLEGIERYWVPLMERDIGRRSVMRM